MLKTLHDAFKNLKAILLGKLEAIQLRFLFFLSYYPLSVTLCGGALLVFYLSFSGSDVHGVGPAHRGTCPACALGLDLEGHMLSDVEACSVEEWC